MTVLTAPELAAVLQQRSDNGWERGAAPPRRADLEARLTQLACTVRPPTCRSQQDVAPHWCARPSRAADAPAAQESGARAVLDRLLGAAGLCVWLDTGAVATLARVQRVCLLNEAHSVQHFLLAEMGVRRWPRYRVQRSHSPFASRAALLAYEDALKARRGDGWGSRGWRRVVERASEVVRQYARQVHR